MKTMAINDISDTAFWICAYRAEESKRHDSLFSDPLAEMLAGDKGQDIARKMSDSRYSSWTVVIRTCVIDEMIDTLIRQNDIEMVVNLGAGLCTRPYRMELPKSIQWVEVDYPDLVNFKNEKLKVEIPKCQLKRIGLDLSDINARCSLFQQLNSYNRKALVLTEGVIPYLTEDQVGMLASDLHKNSNFLYWITEYHSKDMYKHQRSKRKNNEMGGSPFQFFPDSWFKVFNESGWALKENNYLYEKGKTLYRPFPAPLWAKVVYTFLPKKEVEKIEKMLGFVLWVKE
ncbi:SAM-dependent methyltransferase [Shewanella sp. A32]|uniref:class I SAM-dependent methyltransferase n=1 Tax=Shewanella sp. A32 TaxID=3031327 RepID=UPI0023B9C21E|nr:SAM-dependent methyltransferase [Shewanella sp. A32]MDF0535940.1 SAM-dependent methyltransferase [Shewanella sp. A32]